MNKEESREAYKLVLKFFEGDTQKTDLWFEHPNTLLGGLSPDQMIELGRTEKLLEFVKTQIAENEPMEQKEGACKHGHEPHYDDMICVECARENAADFAYEEAARILDEEANQHPEISPELFRGLAEEIRSLKSVSVVSPPEFQALCPHCGGKGQIEASLASGTLYAEVCTRCGNHIGGCIVGGNSPLKEVPKPKECPYCGGPTTYKAAEEI